MGNMSYFKSASLCLPTEVIKGLNRTEERILNYLAEQCIRIHAPSATREFRPQNPSEKWLAQRLGVSREWISKCIRRLERKGFIHVYRRRKENGRFHVNIYYISKKFFNLAKQMLQRFFSKDSWKRIIETENQRIVFLNKKEEFAKKSFSEIAEIHKGLPPEHWLYI